MLHLFKQLEDEKRQTAANTPPTEPTIKSVPAKELSVNLLPTIAKHAEADRQQRFRDKRAFYASSALSCLREQYWDATGVKPTDKIDPLGKMKMLVGSAVEAGLVKEVLSDLHWYGCHLLGTQVPVGGSSPNWDGYLDALVAFKEGDRYKKHVIEIKTKSGYGADLLHDNFTPSDEYLAQLGLYLKDLSEKGITNEGSLLYVLLSDANFGRFVQIQCRYNPETQEIVAYYGSCSDGTWKELNQKVSIKKVLERWKSLEKAVAAKQLPKADYQYKYPVTPELLSDLSDTLLRKMARGEKVHGDWQVLYSKFFSKHLEESGQQRGYTDAELQMIRAEYLRRHPKSKI